MPDSLEGGDPYAGMPGALRLSNDVLIDAETIALRVNAVIDDGDDTIADLWRCCSALWQVSRIIARASEELTNHVLRQDR